MAIAGGLTYKLISLNNPSLIRRTRNLGVSFIVSGWLFVPELFNPYLGRGEEARVWWCIWIDEYDAREIDAYGIEMKINRLKKPCRDIISVGEQGQKLRVDRCFEGQDVALIRWFSGITWLDISWFLVSDFYMDRELFIVFTHLPLPGLISSEGPDSFRRLRPLWQEHFCLNLGVTFGPGLLLALRPVPALREPDGSLVKLGFASVGRLSEMYLVIFMGWLGVVLLGEE